MDFKNSLLLPKTSFPMKACLKENELIIQDAWLALDLSLLLWNQHIDKQVIILHDGPPYANGSLHMGHALNKILKDIYIRFHQMIGHQVWYIPGWDTHGLPIEQKVAELVDKQNTNERLFRQQCKTFAIVQANIQIEQFKRLGLCTNFEKKYFTFNDTYISKQLLVFARLIEQKLVYRDKKPVYWSPINQTSLSEAEIEYIDKPSWSLIVLFDLIYNNETDLAPHFQHAQLLVWTTTPWTLPANQLLAIDKHKTYLLIEVDNRRLILLKNTLADLKNKMQWSIINILDEFIGETLLFQKYRHLLYDTISIIVHGNFISEHQGTGIVHVAGGFGIDDFNLIKEHHLEAFVPINDDGTFAHDFHDPSLRNVFYLDADKIILKKIKLQKQLLFSEKIVHQYPHDWRSKTPVIYKACWQWFVNIEALKPHLYQIIKQINWFNRGDKCMLKMIADRNDWCISRQRQWGVPIPVFYQKNGEPYINKDFVTYFASLVAEHGIEIWWNASVTELLHPWLIKNNITIDIAGWTKEQDIFDVWFDSGASSYAVWANDDNFVAPDLLIEGYDQFRGWFNASLILGSIMDKKTLPYKAVFSHGFVLDNKGNKMSKSVGNVIDPMDICQDYGADILRLWVVSVDYSDDVRISNLLMDKVSESYRKIRNVFRFLLGNLNDYTYDATDINQFSALDNRIIHEVIKHHEAIKQHYQVINFYKLYQNLMNFIVNDLSALYFETNKDVLYVAAQTDPKRKAVQTVLYFILDMLLKCWKPILVHTCEEVFTHWKHHYTSKSVHLLPFKLLTIASKLISPNNDQQWKLILEFRKDVFKYLEQLKIEKTINVTLEVHLKCVLKTDYVFIKDFLNTTLPDLLMISKITFSDEADAEHWHTTSSSYLQAVVGWGQKCQRCWKISTTMILIDKQHVCNNCHKILTQR